MKIDRVGSPPTASNRKQLSSSSVQPFCVPSSHTLGRTEKRGKLSFDATGTRRHPRTLQPLHIEMSTSSILATTSMSSLSFVAQSSAFTLNTYSHTKSTAHLSSSSICFHSALRTSSAPQRHLARFQFHEHTVVTNSTTPPPTIQMTQVPSDALSSLKQQLQQSVQGLNCGLKIDADSDVINDQEEKVCASHPFINLRNACMSANVY